jgi:transketolase
LGLHGGIIPYGGTFLVFSDYMRPAIRLAALTHQRVIYVFTHDSIGLGEDGPTHQPIEQLSALRCIPNLLVIRPADANETAEAWRIAIAHRTGPVALALTRQKLPLIDRTGRGAAAEPKGAYVLMTAFTGSSGGVDTRSGVSLIRSAGHARRRGICARVVSVPSHDFSHSRRIPGGRSA